MARPSVLLISMPWTALTEPSLGLGLLRAILDRSDIPARVLHLNIELLRWLHPTTYVALANVYALNDFLFAGVLDPDVTTRQQRILREKTEILLATGAIAASEVGGVEGLMARLLELRCTTIPGWLDSTAEAIARSDATLVGFTCMFDQTIASLALAKLVKERAPDKMIALGGYAVRAPTSEAILKSFGWIDAIAVAEGDEVIAPLALASAGTIPLAEVPGIVTRAEPGVVYTSPPPPVDMEGLPDPNYDDFRADIAALNRGHGVQITMSYLPLENSRGCWWGALHHCIFCGINDDDLPYRHRSAERVLSSLSAMSRKYAMRRFRFSDYILPHEYYTSLLPKLRELGAPYDLTCELKANISVDRFRALSEGGFSAVQPGIESFSSTVLRRMSKGVTAAQNVLTLKLGAMSRVRVDYNVIYGFPGDGPEDYSVMLDQIPLLRHLDPPASRLEVQITRFAPLQVDPERFGIDRSSHEGAYDLIFSEQFLDEVNFNLDDFCYYFARPFENSPRMTQLFGQLEELIDDWRADYLRDRPILRSRRVAGGLEVVDTRQGQPRQLLLDEDSAALLSRCHTPRLRRELATLHPDAERILAALEGAGLLFRDGDHVIGLPLPETGIHAEEPAPMDASTASNLASSRRSPIPVLNLRPFRATGAPAR